MSDLRKISRREFMKRTGQASGGLVFALTFATACAPEEPAAGPLARAAASVAPNVYVNIRSDGIVEIICHRSEMGQGIRTSLPQVIADELEADWDKIELLQAIGHDKYGSQNTDGSTSIRQQFDLLRNAGATARDMMIAAAASLWGVAAEECHAREHAVHHAASGRSAGFGELVDIAAGMPQPESARFKSRADYRYIGKPMDTIDGKDMTTGAAVYGTDVVLPDMVYASIERCPVFGGTISSIDDTAARQVAGVIDVIRMPEPTIPPMFNIQGGVAVIATNSWAAAKGRAALDIAWDRGTNAGYSSDAYKQKLIASVNVPGNVVLKRGDADVAAASVHEAVYYAPHLAHAPMEPPAAAARINEDGTCEAWACNQNPQAARDTIAETLGVPKEQVTVYTTLLGGGFGRKSKPDFAAEAAWLARETGKPVKVQWTREDDIRNGYLHSVSAQYYRAGMDADGNTISWLQRSGFPSIASTFGAGANGPSGFELDLGVMDNPWHVPNMRIEACDAQAHVRIGWLRSVCNVFHAFGACSFVDELAHMKGKDPLEHFLEIIGPARHINPADDDAEYGNYGQSLDQHPIDTGRLANVARKVAELAGWGRELPDGRGLGIAVHRSFLSYVGAVAEVSVNESGKLVVHEVWTCIDAGLVVNPDRVRAQMEGAAIFGMSIALHGEITAKDGAVVQGNYDTYPMVRMDEAPEAIHSHIMETDAPPGGVGEPGVPPIAPAIVNAYFAATGNRVRELPLRNAGLT
ncbi:MAG: molybdopterin-dependent oxidoreductase [Gammaproteobacteria bacterium]|nr:molybdopterin-dependent oxidoreductase [Gammaproteobacteria bacterium]